jgi:hypothetical protein
MTTQLNHTIVYSSDRTKSARFLAEILGRPAPVRFGPFEVVELDNGVSLDFAAADGPIQPQHYAFLISEVDFDAVFGRIREQGLEYWADPTRSLLRFLHTGRSRTNGTIATAVHLRREWWTSIRVSYLLWYLSVSRYSASYGMYSSVRGGVAFLQYPARRCRYPTSQRLKALI